MKSFFWSTVQASHYHDLIEFAEQHFNTHERVVEGPLVTTLSRKCVHFFEGLIRKRVGYWVGYWMTFLVHSIQFISCRFKFMVQLKRWNVMILICYDDARSKKVDEPPVPIPKYEMIIYTKANSISTSHLTLYDQDSVLIACNIFKDLCRCVQLTLRPSPSRISRV